MNSNASDLSDDEVIAYLIATETLPDSSAQKLYKGSTYGKCGNILINFEKGTQGLYENYLEPSPKFSNDLFEIFEKKSEWLVMYLIEYFEVFANEESLLGEQTRLSLYS